MCLNSSCFRHLCNVRKCKPFWRRRKVFHWHNAEKKEEKKNEMKPSLVELSHQIKRKLENKEN